MMCMAMIMCPECGTKISDKALSCPQCAFTGENPSQPISEQATYEKHPVFQAEIERWDPKLGQIVTEYIDISPNTSRKLFKLFADPKIFLSIPELGRLIADTLGEKDVELVAKMPDYIMKLVDEEVLHFRRDANGQIMPFVFDNKEKVFKQVRLDWNQVDPDITPTLRHLETQMAISTVLAEVQSLREEIAGIHIELQNDRLALAESAWDKLMQARTIEDARLREMLVVQAITTATDAKRTLMRNFTENMKYLDAHSGKKFVERVQDKGMVKAAQETVQGIATNPNRGKAADAFHDLVSIINAVRVEGTGYEILEQDEASKECLIEFRKFIIDNKLDERNTLLVINSNLGVDEKMSSEIINQFSNVAKHIAMLDNLQELEASAALALEPYIEKNEHSNSTNVSGKAENENLQKED